MVLDDRAAVADPSLIIADLRRELAQRTVERDEAQARETATAEIVQMINSSLGDRAPVFEAILEKARILCGAAHGSLSLYDGQRFRAVAINTESQELADRMRQGFSPSDFPYLKPLLDGARLAHVPDLAEVGNPYGARTGLFIPLRKDDTLLGLISTVRLEIRPFSDKEIALVENFAAQAVIAMENARLLTETREALEQQTATAEMLQVINASPGGLEPVFDAMLERATRLCDAASGTFITREGELARSVAFRNNSIPYAEFLTHEPVQLKTIFGPNFLDGPVVHISDLRASEAYRRRIPLAVAAVELGGIRTFLALPLIKDGTLIGGFVIFRQEVRPFTDKQIALLQNFAEQAVIAMENARLLGELRQRTEEVAELNRGLEARVSEQVRN
jgi:GAF domain-containing protein